MAARQQVLCVCRGACVDAKALRAVLARVLGSEFHAGPQGDTRTPADVRDFGGALPRKRA